MKTQQLKILAQQATPWPWKWFTSNSHNRLSSVASGKDGDVISAFKAVDGAACVSISHDDMAFIEAAHPGAVLELIERLEAAERERDELRREKQNDNRYQELLKLGTAVVYECDAAVQRAEVAEAELARRDAAAGEPVDNPVLGYADSYRRMASRGVENVPIWSVITDLERNIAPLYTGAPPAVLSPEKITEIMQDAWNEFCDDTGCYPDDFEYQNEKLFFDAGRWAMLVAERISSLGAQQQKVVALPDHKFRECVNGLLEEAIAYAGTQQLRARLSSRLSNFVKTQRATGVKWEVKK